MTTITRQRLKQIYAECEERDPTIFEIRELVRIALAVPDTLPCAVELKSGLIIGRGCKTETLLTALQRHADYYAEIDAMTPEERAKHDANIAAFKAMLPQLAQRMPDMNGFRPCPFCNSPVKWCGENSVDPDDEHVCHHIQCTNPECGADFDFINTGDDLLPDDPETLDAMTAAECLQPLRNVCLNRFNNRASMLQASNGGTNSKLFTITLPALPVLGSREEWYQGFAAGAGSMREECAAALISAGIDVEVK